MSVPYLHGGDINRVAREAGVTPERILDFSSNINPMGPPGRAAKRLAREATDPSTWTRYPDPEAGELRSALSRYAAVPPECIAIAAGADSLIQAAIRTFAPRRSVISIPAFSEYERACRAAGCEDVFVPLSPDFSLDRGTLQLLRLGDLLVLNNPHNPSGRERRNLTVKLSEDEGKTWPRARVIEPGPSGYADLAVTTWFGFAAPAGLPQPIALRMNHEIASALNTAPVRDRLLAEGFELETMSPEALTAFIRDGLARWGPLARRLMAPDAGR